MSYVYILYSQSRDRFYIGHTSTTIERRFEKHLQKHRGFTSTANDWEVVYSEEFPNKSEA